MSISDSHFPQTEPYGLQLTPDQSGIDGPSSDDAYSSPRAQLEHSVQSAGFTKVAPALQSVREQIYRPETRILDTLTENINRLQDAFMDGLYAELKQEGVNTAIKLTLRLDAEAELILFGEHPHKERIIRLIDKTPGFASAFREIAAQSAALRDLRNICALTQHEETENRYAALAQRPGENIYQLSLKGDMSHFYFTR